MKKPIFLILILSVYGTLFSSEILSDSKDEIKTQTTSQNVFLSDNEVQADQLSDDLNGKEVNSQKQETRVSKFKNAVKRITKKLGPIEDLFLNTYFYIGLIFFILTGIFLGNQIKKTGYFNKKPRYSLLAIFSFLLVLAGLVCGLFGLWPLLTTFGIFGLVIGHGMPTI